MEPIIDVTNLHRSFFTTEREIAILENIQLSVNAGERVAVLGASGSGKSTLLGLMAGLDVPSSGAVTIDGAAFSAKSEDERARIRGEYMGFVFQQFYLLPNLTALENVSMPLEMTGDKRSREKALAKLQAVGLNHRISHHPGQLSGGEQQRVAIARAFVNEPRILFADEPTGNLDQATGATVSDLLFQLNREHQTTLVLVTHDEQLAARCDRRMLLRDGRLRQI